MKAKTALRFVAALAALATLGAACSGDDDDTGAATDDTATDETAAGDEGDDTATTEGGGGADFVALGGWDDGECSADEPAVELGISAPVDVAGTSLGGYVAGAEAAVEAFNARGGISGRCMNITFCEGAGDGPTELSCARDFTENADVVAGIASTYIAAEGDAYQLFDAAGLPQIGAQVTQPGAWNSPVSFEFTMGGSGTLLAGMPALQSIDVTDFALMAPASGQIGAFAGFAQPLIDALGMNLVEIIQIPPTAVEFTQFVLAAQEAGAQGALLGLPGNVASQVIDAIDSLGSDIKFSVSWGTFSRDQIAELPEEIAANMAFTDAVPPVRAGSEEFPIFDVIIDDFSGSDSPELEEGAITAQATNAWLSIYSLVAVMRDAEATEITRETVRAAFEAATDVEMFGLVPPWTPSQQSENPIFTGISNSNYWTGTWDAEAGEFVVDPEQVDVLALLG